ncbi:hypothetical protein TKK_0006415 [Trichogramma kaykai]
MFIKRREWQEEDLVAFIVDEFNGNVKDINWILKTVVERDRNYDIIIPLLMENDTELQVLNDLGQTAIHIAARKRMLSAMELLVEDNPKFGSENLSDKQGFTYFHAACSCGYDDVVQKYIDQGVDVNCIFFEDGLAKTPLSLAIEFHQIAVGKLLLNNGANLKLVDEWSTPLRALKTLYRPYCEDLQQFIGDHYFKNVEMNSEVIENRSDEEGFTDLHAACMYGNIKRVQKFIDQEENLDLIWQSLDGFNESPLTLAVKFNRTEIVKLLLKNGANPNMKLLEKNPLHVFFESFHYNPNIKYDEFGLLEILTSYNCDVNAKDRFGRSPLYHCFQHFNEDPEHFLDDPECLLDKLFNDHKHIETLLKNKADVNEVFDNGQSILHLFINSMLCTYNIYFACGIHTNLVSIKLLKTLLKYGANPNAKDNNDITPFQLAVLNKNYKVVEVLLEHGADVQSVDFSKLNFQLETSTQRFKVIIKFFTILQFLNNKGYKMNESSFLAVLKFLIESVSFNPKNRFQVNMENTLLFGSSTQIRSLRNYYFLENEIKDERTNYRLVELLHQYLIIEKGNMFITTEVKDCLQKLQQFYIYKKESTDSFNDDISLEIENVKKLMIKDGVSLLDVCALSPEKAYDLVKNFEFWTIFNSDKFECELLHDTIMAYIAKSFIKKFVTDNGLEYLILLTQGKLPPLWCKQLIQYLSNEDILLVCEALIN